MVDLSTEIAAARPEEQREVWFCEIPPFWGTGNQLVLCVKCGPCEHKRHDEPRHFRDTFKPTFHLFCDECWDSLPDEYEHPYSRSQRAAAIAKSLEEG